MRGVILYGPPASGKDTVTAALTALDGSYTLFQRLKAGGGRTQGYRPTTAPEIDQLRATGQVVWENRRYEATYVVDRAGLTAALASHTPVLHLGQVDAVKAVAAAMPAADWTVVQLWCPRREAERRMILRDTGDTDTRLTAWDETEPLPDAHITINTARLKPTTAATLIDTVVTHADRSTAGLSAGP